MIIFDDTYTTTPFAKCGIESDTLIACSEDCSLSIVIFRSISVLLLGALTAAEPKYEIHPKRVHS